ncbi:unnamed protein product [Urochloa decumbens]|uniref:CASP-like protein n=1 Tax=Urochloa decumbens TaxID=240449 RepID=A0ABC9AJR1_9POAL
MAISARARALAVVTLVFRIIALGLLAASLIVIATTARTQYDPFYLKVFNGFLGVELQVYEAVNINFQDLYTYRYVLSTAAIGCAYTLILIPLEIIAVVQQGKRIGGTSTARILIFTDVVFCALFTSGGAAGLGLVVDNQHRNRKLFDSDHRKFYVSFDASCGLLLVAAICTVVIIMISAYSK